MASREEDSLQDQVMESACSVISTDADCSTLARKDAKSLLVMSLSAWPSPQQMHQTQNQHIQQQRQLQQMVLQDIQEANRRAIYRFNIKVILN